MSSRVVTRSPTEGLHVSLAAYKSLVSDYALRARQAEDMAHTLMCNHITTEVFQSIIVNKLKEHIDARGIERSTQYLGLLQTALLALTNLQRGLKTLSPEEIDAELITTIKALTIAVNPL